MKPEIISIAEKYLGIPFHYHKCDLHHQQLDPKLGFDCSGFVRLVLQEAGYHLPSGIIHARELFDFWGTHISPEQAQLGDLIFFTQRGTTPNHVAFVTGKDIVIFPKSQFLNLYIPKLRGLSSMIPIAKPLLGAEEKRAVLEVLDSSILAQGKKVAEFEHDFARYIGVKHAIATSNGTTALHAAL